MIWYFDLLKWMRKGWGKWRIFLAPHLLCRPDRAYESTESSPEGKMSQKSWTFHVYLLYEQQCLALDVGPKFRELLYHVG